MQAASSSGNFDWQSEIVALEDAANEAFMKRDLERLDQLFSDALIVNSPINVVSDKRKVLDLLGRRIIGHVSSTIEHEVMRRDGDLVVVMDADAVRNSESEPLLPRRFTNVWRREGDHWRLFVRHANVIAEGSGSNAPPRAT